jgi:alkanesulfonate monooxygenase SsuD/methylene tetrahydromethanopterin reductase-like flavin-dependent oxidoreductase (luciferase family)
MQVGLALGVSGLPLREHLAIARDAEAAGVRVLCVGEASTETFATASAVAGVTGRARLVSSVATWARPPVLTALAASTVDELSSGRYTLGLGPMPPAWNRDHYGIDPARPLARMREYVDVVRAALRASDGRQVDYRGEFFSVRGYARRTAAVRPDLPVHLAATRAGMARLAGQVADGVIYNFLHTQRWLEEVLEPALRDGEAATGRRVERAAMVRVLVEPDTDAAREAMRAGLAAYRTVPYLAEVAGHGGHRPDDPEFLDASGVTGPADACVALLQERYGQRLDWVELTPPSGLEPERLRQAYRDLVEVAVRSTSTPSAHHSLDTTRHRR